MCERGFLNFELIRVARFVLCIDKIIIVIMIIKKIIQL